MYIYIYIYIYIYTRVCIPWILSPFQVVRFFKGLFLSFYPTLPMVGFTFGGRLPRVLQFVGKVPQTRPHDAGCYDQAGRAGGGGTG